MPSNIPKVNRIGQWKYMGVICEDWNKLYENYINTKNCDYCKIDIVEGCGKNSKKLDHCHQTGKVRGILCNRCNTIDVYNETKPIKIDRTLKGKHLDIYNNALSKVVAKRIIQLSIELYIN